MENVRSVEEHVTIREDLSIIKLRKERSSTFPSYKKIDKADSVDKAEKSHKLIKRSNGDNRTSQISPFVLYGDAYRRKTTALYLLQENFQISSDRLLRVPAIQPSHLFAGMDINDYALSKTVRAGDLCIFRRVNRKDKCLLGRIVRFSYLSGTKRNRQYSSDYVDMTKPSHVSIGVLANWFQGTKTE